MKISDEKLLFVCLIISLIGLVGLFLIYYFFDPPLIDFAELEDVSLDKTVKIEGVVLSVSTYDSVSFLELESSCFVSAVKFNDDNINNNDNINLDDVQIGDFVEVVGTVDSYKGEKQILINKLILK